MSAVCCALRNCLQARAADAEGRIDLDKLRAAEDRAILQVLEKQHELGLDIVTDGEMRRGSWLTDMADAVDGFVSARVALEWKGPGGGVEGSTAHAVGGKLRKVRKMTGHEVPFLKKNAQGPFKVTLPAPSNFMLASYKTGISDKFYPAHADLLKDLVEIVRDDVRWLVSEGVSLHSVRRTLLFPLPRPATARPNAAGRPRSGHGTRKRNCR